MPPIAAVSELTVKQMRLIGLDAVEARRLAAVPDVIQLAHGGQPVQKKFQNDHDHRHENDGPVNVKQLELCNGAVFCGVGDGREAVEHNGVQTSDQRGRAQRDHHGIQTEARDDHADQIARRGAGCQNDWDGKPERPFPDADAVADQCA